MGNRIFVIGASLSGIDALCKLIGNLPANFPAPILITQHVASHSPGMLPYLLGEAGKLPAMHPRHLQPIEPRRIYVAPPDRHMLVQKGHIRLSHGPRENLARPAIDPLFRSAALSYGPSVVGIVLTGQLDDGTAGLLAIKDQGGTTIVQDPSEATAASMPRSALQTVKVDFCCRLKEMAAHCVALAEDDPAGEHSAVNELMEIESRIADGVFTPNDWWHLERMSTPSGMNCPSCRSALYELTDKRVLRFRCRSGHAFSCLSLLSGQAEARETQLSTIFGALTEEMTLLIRMLGMAPFRADRDVAHALNDRIQDLKDESGKVCEWLRTTSGLVEPEPIQSKQSPNPAS